MTGYLIRRVLGIIPTFFFVTVLVFSLIQLAPGTALDFYLSANPDAASDPRRIEVMTKRLGLDRPVYVQYLIWAKGLLCLDFGYSFETHRPISVEIGARAGATAALFLFSHMISWPLAVLIGMLSALRPNSLWDHISRAVSLVGIAMPAFWVGLMLIVVFAVTLRWFPIGGSLSASAEYGGIFQTLGDRAWHLVLPALTIAVRSIAMTMRMTRAEMLEVLRKDYIATARAKGLREYVVYFKHALRNGLMPIVTLMGLSMGTILSGAVLTESVFGWPGIGRYLVHAVHVRDYPAVMAVTVVASMMVLLANLAADLAYTWINPTVRY